MPRRGERGVVSVLTTVGHQRFEPGDCRRGGGVGRYIVEVTQDTFPL